MDEEKARQRKSNIVPNEDQHISLSSPDSSPYHSEHGSGVESAGHISLSPPPPSSPGNENRQSAKGDQVSEESNKERRTVSEDLPANIESRGSHGDGKKRGYKQHPSLSIRKRVKRDETIERAALGLRVLGLMFCLISFSVMAADRNQGWALDSFDHYIEFRYCLSLNMIGFVYCGAQALDRSYKFATRKHIFPFKQKFRRFFDFTADQIIAYLLLSASSSATVRIDLWKLNWGRRDKFPDMATASISVSFLAFVALASNSMLSGYVLCTHRSL